MSDSPDLIDGLVGMREALLREAESVPVELRQMPFVGRWNLMDLLAHLVGWDYTNIRAVEELKAGSRPSFYQHYNPGWAEYNQQLVERYGAGDWDELRESLRQSQDAVVAMLRQLTVEELTREVSDPGRRRPITIAGILRAAVRDEREHLGQLRGFLAARGA